MEPDNKLLEAEFEQAVSSRLPAAENDNRLSPGSGGKFLEGRDRRFRQLLNALPAAIYTTDAQGRLTSFNEAAVALWGVRPELGISRWCGAMKLFTPDGRPMAHDQCPMAVALREDRRVRGAEAIAERPDGSRVPFMPYPTPLHDENGNLVGAVNMLVDLSERKRAEDQQMIMVRELHHRVRNTLAIVQAVMGSTAKTAQNIYDFKDALTGRIAALAKTNLLLTEDTVSTASFERILHNELDAFDDGSAQRVQFHGPRLEVPSRLVVPLGMAIHELTTNAVHHGALSVLGGHVIIDWSVTMQPSWRTLEIDWREYGGPPVQGPARHGFGAHLLETVLPRQIGAKGTIDFRPEGVRVHYSVPLPAEAQTTAH